MKSEDFQRDSCTCPECTQAGVSTVPQIRDRHSGAYMHGYDLKRWYTARERFRTAARAAVGPRGRHDNGFEKLVNR